MARNRVIYQSEAVFVSKNITSSGAFAHSQLRRIQSANYNYSVQRTDVNQFANLARVDAIVIEQPVVNLELTYLIGDGFNEKALGFTLEKDYDAQFGKEMFGSNFSGQNFYITTVEEGLDANLSNQSAITSALANNKTSIIGIGNGYITNYSADFTVGALAIASVSIEASNIMSSANLSRKSSYEEGYTNIPIASINPSDGVKRTEQVSLDFANAGLTDGIAALRPGDVTVTIANSGIASNTFAVQSAKIAFPMSRESISKVGSRFAVAKVATFPIVSTITISATLGDLAARNLADQIDSTNTTDITLTVTGGSDNQEKISYRLKKCKLDSESFSASIGSNKTVELTFSTQIGGSNDSTNGIFVNADSEESPFEFYLDAYNNMPAALRNRAFYFATYNDTPYTVAFTSISAASHQYRVYNSAGTLLDQKNSNAVFTSATQKGLKVFAVVHVDGSGNLSNSIGSFVVYTGLRIVDFFQFDRVGKINVSGQKLKNLELLTSTSLPAVIDVYDPTPNYPIIELNVANNNLTSLNLVNFGGDLEILNCSNNKLTYLGITNNSTISSLNCSNNKLTTLPLPSTELFDSIDASNNELTSLIVNATFLIDQTPIGINYLNLSNNALTTLDLNGVLLLETIILSNNKLNTLTLPATLNSAINIQIINCNLNVETINDILFKIDSAGTVNGTFLFAGNQTNGLNTGRVTTLQSRGWQVAYQ